MAIEIERKFLVGSTLWQASIIKSSRIEQAYLTRNSSSSVRVRVVDGLTATLTIKSAGSKASRLEFEYPIPLADARELMELRDGHVVTKVRNLVPYGGLVWEVDVFDGRNAGLVLAEIELSDERQLLPLPAWVGREVTGDPHYYNGHLSRHPYAGTDAPAGSPQVHAASSAGDRQLLLKVFAVHSGEA